MTAAYDSFDYPSYWTDREYEHKSEIIALNAFLKEIKKINTIIDVGCGFGRLFLSYSYRAQKIILVDPSIKLLRIAKETFQKRKNVQYIVSNLNGLPKKTRAKADLVIMIRVIHHIDDPDKAFEALNRLINKKGYLILEFANKRHGKAVFLSLMHRNFRFFKDRQTSDIRSDRNIRNNSLPFLNYHPEIIENLLNEHGFEVLDKRSVSNVRIPFLKSIMPLELLLAFETLLQKPLANLYFGPSIFVLARKI